MDMYVVMCVSLDEGSGYKPKAIAFEKTYAEAMSKAVGYMKSWLAENSKKSFSKCIKDGTACFSALHVWDCDECNGIQLSIQRVSVECDVSVIVS